MFMLRLDELIVALRERDSKRKSAAVTNSTALGLGRTRRDFRDINFILDSDFIFRAGALLHLRASSSSDFISDGEDS